VEIYLIDGTYELFRQYFGRPSSRSSDGREIGATRGVVASVASLLSSGVTHLGVATDHVIKSFRNEMWTGYKSGAETPEALLSQFGLLEEALESLGVKVWPMVELEADDALASAAAVAKDDPRVDKVLICTPDKDLAQSVVGRRVVQLDRRTGTLTDEDGVRARYGIAPASIPDWLALVGDSADGFPGLSGWGRRSASVVLARYGHIAAIPDTVADWDNEVIRAVRGAPNLAARLGSQRELAMLFLSLATLRIDTSLLGDVEELRWRGPAPNFEAMSRYLREGALGARMTALAAS
jgi:5'-3' exonuclease